METVNNVLNKYVDMHKVPTEEKVRATLDGLDRLLSELERPENRELMLFAFAWQKLDQELTALQIKLHERMAQKPINLINEFLKKLQKKN